MKAHVEAYDKKIKSQKKLNKLLKEQDNYYSYSYSSKDSNLLLVEILICLQEGAKILKKNDEKFIQIFERFSPFQKNHFFKELKFSYFDKLTPSKFVYQLADDFHTDFNVFSKDFDKIKELTLNTTHLKEEESKGVSKILNQFKYSIRKYYFKDYIDWKAPFIADIIRHKKTGYFLHYFLSCPIEKIDKSTVDSDMQKLIELKQFGINLENKIEGQYPLLFKSGMIRSKNENIDHLLEIHNELNSIKMVDKIKKHFKIKEELSFEQRHFSLISLCLEPYRYGFALTKNDFKLLYENYEHIDKKDFNPMIKKFIELEYGIFNFSSFQTEKECQQFINNFQYEKIEKNHKKYYKIMVTEPKKILKTHQMFENLLDVQIAFFQEIKNHMKKWFKEQEFQAKLLEFDQLMDSNSILLNNLKTEGQYYTLRAVNKHLRQGNFPLNEKNMTFIKELTKDYFKQNRKINFSDDFFALIEQINLSGFFVDVKELKSHPPQSNRKFKI